MIGAGIVFWTVLCRRSSFM